MSRNTGIRSKWQAPCASRVAAIIGKAAFFDPEALSQQVDHLLQNLEQRQKLGQCANQRILEGGYALKNTLKQQLQLLDQVIRG